MKAKHFNLNIPYSFADYIKVVKVPSILLYCELDQGMGVNGTLFRSSVVLNNVSVFCGQSESVYSEKYQRTTGKKEKGNTNKNYYISHCINE